MLEIYILLAIISVLIVFVIWPEISLYSIAFLLPVIGWLFYWQGYILPLIDLTALLALSAFAIRFFIDNFIRNQKRHIRWPLFLPFFIFISINLLSSFFSSNIIYSLWNAFRWPIFLYFGYIFLPYNLITDSKVLKKTIISLVLGSMAVLISGFLSLYGQDWRDSFFRIRSISIGGIFPFGENHNLIAEYLNVGVFLILTLREWTKNARVKRMCNLAFVLTCLGIILTFSRAGWITLALQAIIYFWFYFRSKNVKPLTMVIASLSVLIICSPLFWKMNQLQKDNVSSTENRLLLTEIAVQAFEEKPILGYGSGQFINLVDSNIRFKAKYGAAIDSHGMIQKVLAENGIFGLASWIFLLLYLIKICYESLKKYYRLNPWILPLYLAGAGGLFFQLFNTSYYKGKVWLPIAVSLATMRLMAEKYGKKNKQAD